MEEVQKGRRPRRFYHIESFGMNRGALTIAFELPNGETSLVAIFKGTYTAESSRVAAHLRCPSLATVKYPYIDSEAAETRREVDKFRKG